MKRLKMVLALILALVVLIQAQPDPEQKGSKLEQLKSMEKIDVHMHIKSDQKYLFDFMDKWNFKFCSVVTSAKGFRDIQGQIDNAKKLVGKYPRYYAWITSFDATTFESEGWAEKVIAQLREDFKNGALGVKVWKNIGMEIKKANGEYLQLDDPVFTPVFEFIAAQGKTLLAHMGEPIHAWMPTYFTKEGVGRNYWAKRPEYSFWDKPDKPSYSDILAARDHVIERHPDLRFVGAHLGSMEFDVDEMITRFEKYPNFAVELGGRTRYFMWQAKGKVYDFFMRYQDRIMYGTDRGSSLVMSDEQKKETYKELEYRNSLFMRYYATAEEIPWGNIISGDKPRPKSTYKVSALDLPMEVLEKVFYKNAVRWFPGIDKDYK
jgi:predicted TIM-barrel fold metal-dependent hydrolase